MTDIDKLARELEKAVSKAFFGHTVENPRALYEIKSALTAFRNEALEEAARLVESHRCYPFNSPPIRYTKNNSVRAALDRKFYSASIRKLKEREE